MASQTPATRPLVTFDIDGVLARSPFGINPGGLGGNPTAQPRFPRPTWFLERWLYRTRRPMPGAAEGFHQVAQRFDVACVSARGEESRAATETWLANLLGLTPDVYLRPTWREKSSAFKGRVIPPMNPLAHFEDDPNTALLLSQRIPHVFLVDWPRNRGLERRNIHRITKIGDAVPILEELVANSATPNS